MKKKLFSIYLLLSMAFMACGQSKQVTDASYAADKLDNALLWRITGNDVAESYLFGTIHLIPAEDYFLPEGTEVALERSDVVVFEIDMEDMMDLGAQMALITKAFMPDGVSLSDLLSSEDYALVNAHFEGMGMPMFMLERIKPLFLSVFAGGDFSMDDFSTGAATSYEMEFYELAQAREIDVGGLETMEFQLAVFDSIPLRDQARMLVETIKFGDSDNSQYQELLSVYKSQDINKLHDLIASTEQGMGEYEDLLLANRNRNWIGSMTDYMTDGSAFFAVGAGHLAGRNGVINLLREAGYNVEAVTDMKEAPSKREKKRF